MYLISDLYLIYKLSPSARVCISDTDRLGTFFNYITTGAFTPVGPVLAPVVNLDFLVEWAKAKCVPTMFYFA
jgi:hypothetical protein